MRVHRCGSWTMIWMALLLCVVSSCHNQGFLERKIAELDTAVPGDCWVLKNELVAIGPSAVPALVQALQREDALARSCSCIVAALKGIRDPRAVPALVRVADGVDSVVANEGVLGYPDDWPCVALEAREALAQIADPAAFQAFGSRVSTTAGPGTASYDEVMAVTVHYYKKVNEWYESWRKTYRAQEWPGRELLNTGPDPVEGTVKRCIQAVCLLPKAREGAETLVHTGAKSVPALVALVEKKDQVASIKLVALGLLERIGDRRCVPALVRTADSFDLDELEHPVTAITTENPATVVLRARQAIGVIVDPANREKFGAWETTDAPPGTEGFNKVVRVQLAYYERVNAWYAKWRKTYVPESYAGR